jgi:hypothetical protein
MGQNIDEREWEDAIAFGRGHQTILISWNNLKRGTDIRTRDNAKQTLLYTAASTIGAQKIVTCLLDRSWL